jgi:MFS family permease
MDYMGLDAKDPNDQGLIGAMTSVYLAASIVAGILFSPPICHYFGRRMPIFVGCLLVIVASFIQTFSTNVAGFMGGRVVLGIGQGIALSAGPILMGELCAPDIRGRMLSFWQLMYSVGALVTSYTAYGVKLNASLGLWQWKIVTLVQAVIPFVTCCLIFFVPESKYRISI